MWEHGLQNYFAKRTQFLVSALHSDKMQTLGHAPASRVSTTEDRVPLRGTPDSPPGLGSRNEPDLLREGSCSIVWHKVPGSRQAEHTRSETGFWTAS